MVDQAPTLSAVPVVSIASLADPLSPPNHEPVSLRASECSSRTRAGLRSPSTGVQPAILCVSAIPNRPHGRPVTRRCLLLRCAMRDCPGCARTWRHGLRNGCSARCLASRACLVAQRPLAVSWTLRIWPSVARCTHGPASSCPPLCAWRLLGCLAGTCALARCVKRSLLVPQFVLYVLWYLCACLYCHPVSVGPRSSTPLTLPPTSQTPPFSPDCQFGPSVVACGVGKHAGQSAHHFAIPVSHDHEFIVFQLLTSCLSHGGCGTILTCE